MVKDLSSTAAVYFERFSYCEQELSAPVNEQLELIVVIPCFDEEELIKSLTSLNQCDIPKDISIEVITVVNHGVTASEEVKKRNEVALSDAKSFAIRENSNQLTFHTIEAFDLPKKHAGVGLARKIGMDEALRRFASINKDGVIVCFDADSGCEQNYFKEIYKHFKKFNKSPGCSIHFEHPFAGTEHEESVYQAITQYELHLRYYKNAIQFTKHPYAYHTIGSSMAVRASAYAKQGGMNKRKAGEDFYFLSKIIALGNFSELSSTKVIPSPRISDRVPFGTGRAVGDILRENEGQELELYSTYNFSSFVDLKVFFDLVVCEFSRLKFSELPNSIKEFIDNKEFDVKMKEISKNTTSDAAFLNRFFKVFDTFWVLKFVHFSRDHFYKNQSVLSASNLLLNSAFDQQKDCSTEKEALEVFRKLDA